MSALLFIFIIGASIVLTQDSRSSIEHYCYVQSPIDLSIFNLTTIQHDDYDSTVRINEFEHLRVHFCRPLKDPCNGKHDYAVCLHSNDIEIGVGNEPPYVAIELGEIMFRYTGDKCNETHNYTVDVEIKCHYSKKEKVATDLDIVFNRDGCNFQMSIESIAACSKRKQAKCDLSDKTGYYDLSPLMNLGSNYMIKLNESSSVILNVCHSLLYGHHFHQCDDETMVCLVDDTKEQRKHHISKHHILTSNLSYTRLGNINDDMRFSTNNGTVHLDLTSDTHCYDNRLKIVRTTIEFVCQKNATNTMPEYVSGYGTCHYKFRWLTTAACSEDTLIKQSDIQHQPCKVLDSQTSLYYDLSTLSGTVLYVNSSDGKAEYQFSLCTPLQKSNCTKSGTGVCKYVKNKNIAVSKGQANTNLMRRREYIYLNYTDGMACGNNRRSYTIIIFKCSRTNNTLLIDDHDPCATIITWTSSTICKNTYDVERLLDVLTAENLYHWRLLTRHHTNYIVQGKSNTTQYHLNVGVPLVEDQFTTCSNGTGVCKVVTDAEGRRIKELNLGYQASEEYITKDGGRYLRYLNGSICEEDRSKTISTEVKFSCDWVVGAIRGLLYEIDDRFPGVEFLLRLVRILQGTPTFKSYDNCKYYFDWETSHACEWVFEEISAGCSITNAFEIFNLTYLNENSLFKVNRDNSGHFSARYCKDKNRCNGTFICNTWPYNGINIRTQLDSMDRNPFARIDLTTKVDFTNSIVAFKFANESQCKKDTHYEAVINKWCEMWAGIAEPFLLKEKECTIGLDWDKHITACPLKENANDSANIPPTDGLYAQYRIHITTFLAIVLTILLVITVAQGIIIYRSKKKRVISANDANNAVIRYRSLKRGSEPTVDVDIQ